MNSTALIVLCILLFVAVVGTAVSRWRENHPHDGDAAWGRLSDDPRDLIQTQKSSDRKKSAKKKRKSAPDYKQAYEPKSMQKGKRRSRWIVFVIIVCAALIIPLIYSRAGRSFRAGLSERPKSHEAREALSSLESQMKDLFYNVETDSSYASSLGYIVSGNLTDDDNQYYRASVEVSLSEEGVIRSVQYMDVLPYDADRETAVSDMKADFETIHDSITLIEGTWASDNLKNDPEIPEDVENALLPVSPPDSSENNFVEDIVTFDDGCEMRCEEYGGRSIYVRFTQYG